jgi:hypothetical protein
MTHLVLQNDSILSDLYKGRFDGLLYIFQTAKERNLNIAIYNGINKYHYIQNYTSLRELPYSPLPHPILDYDFLLLRAIELDQFELLEAMDDFEKGKGFVDWWFVLDFELRRHPEILKGEETKWSTFAWNHIGKHCDNISVCIVSNPRFFVYVHNTIHTKLKDHEYYKTLQNLTHSCFSSSVYAKVITTEWMKYKPARDIYSDRQNKSSKVVNCDIEASYVQALLYEKEVECQRVLLDIFLPSSILDVSRYIVKTYL